ncbi:hypothetical protein JTB14_036412 [Gonioctena quinquepunctata]|nr:hypothetical protein JTB14_036412 [Gonioctena quinquepunctata]
MSEEDKKSLGRQRGAVKSKLTLFSNHLKTLEGKSLSEANIINLEERISKADAIFTDFDNLQNQIQNLVSESEMEAQHQERAVFEDTFFAAIASAKQIALKYKKEHEQQIDANASTDVSSNHDENNVHVLEGVKFPVISLPKFDGNMDSWLESRDTFQSLIHDNMLINNIQKYHFLRTCLENGAAQVIRFASRRGTPLRFILKWVELFVPKDLIELVDFNFQKMINKDTFSHEGLIGNSFLNSPHLEVCGRGKSKSITCRIMSNANFPFEEFPFCSGGIVNPTLHPISGYK